MEWKEYWKWSQKTCLSLLQQQQGHTRQHSWVNWLNSRAAVSCLKSGNNSTSQAAVRVLEGPNPTGCWKNDLSEGTSQTMKYFAKCLLPAGNYLPNRLETPCQKRQMHPIPGYLSECLAECPPHDKWSINICFRRSEVSLAAAGNRWQCPTALLLLAALQPPLPLLRHLPPSLCIPASTSTRFSIHSLEPRERLRAV